MTRHLPALVLAMACVSAAGAQTSYAGRDDVQQFVAEMVARHGFVKRELDAVFAKVRFQASILRAMSPTVPGKRSWQSYRERFLTPQRVEGGIAFWTEHEATLERAALTYGVPPEVVVAIIGIETEYGQQMGGYRVVDALATLAFDYPRRAEFFRGELEAFLLLAREASVDVLGVRGSYAGAVGIPQFMPDSYRRYAVDFDGDGRRDLRESVDDAIGSVANFLAEHGWRRGEPIAFRASLAVPEARALADGGVDPVHTAAALRLAAVRFPESVPADAPAVLIELDSVDAPAEYWVGLTNFYVVTRYNRSSFYATAVLELATAIKVAKGDAR